MSYRTNGLLVLPLKITTETIITNTYTVIFNTIIVTQRIIASSKTVLDGSICIMIRL